jgi:hypothetical protein
MYHQDGRCASNAETLVVTTGGTLPTSVPAGIRLLVIRGSVSGTIAWTLPASPQMSIVGQSTGILTGTGSVATLEVTSGDLYIRALTITGGSPGVWATGGAILRLDHVSVSNNTAGGILLDGAGFDIKDTTVDANGGNTAGTVIFGGVGIQNTPTSAVVPKSFALSTISTNQQIGVSCGTGAAFSPTPTSVFASGNTGGQIGGACGFSTCTPASTTCGAQP